MLANPLCQMTAMCLEGRFRQQAGSYGFLFAADDGNCRSSLYAPACWRIRCVSLGRCFRKAAFASKPAPTNFCSPQMTGIVGVHCRRRLAGETVVSDDRDVSGRSLSPASRLLRISVRRRCRERSTSIVGALARDLARSDSKPGDAFAPDSRRSIKHPPPH